MVFRVRLSLPTAWSPEFFALDRSCGMAATLPFLVARTCGYVLYACGCSAWESEHNEKRVPDMFL